MKILNIKAVENTGNLEAIESKEKIKSLELIAFHEGRFKVLANVRWYMSRSAKSHVVYCVVRLNSYLMPVEFNNSSTIATGKDDHYGQDRVLVSFNNAIKKAGITFEDSKSIEEPETILQAIAKANYNNYDNLFFARG